MIRLLTTATLLASLAACDVAPPFAATGGPAPSPGGRSDAARIAACRDRSDAAYRAQNRGTIYTGTDERDTPFSGNYVSGDTARGLGNQFGRDNAYDDCLRAAALPAPAPSRMPDTRF